MLSDTLTRYKTLLTTVTVHGASSILRCPINSLVYYMYSLFMHPTLIISAVSSDFSNYNTFIYSVPLTNDFSDFYY